MILKMKIQGDNLYTQAQKNSKQASMLCDFYVRTKENKKGKCNMKYFNGIPIVNCSCGADPHFYGEGTAFEEYDEYGNKEMYFVDFYGYTVECQNCSKMTYSHRTPEEAIAAWNAMMED